MTVIQKFKARLKGDNFTLQEMQAKFVARNLAKHIYSCRYYASSPKWGLFSDIHFDDRGLDRVVETSKWILKEFKQQNVSSIICLGDVLNTRENVSVQSLHAALNFFDDLEEIAPVYVILGNHDMNLKHTGRVSSLDALSMRSLDNKFKLYRDIQPETIDGVQCVMMPYHEDVGVIGDWIKSHPEHCNDASVGFTHMAINGAIQRYMVDNLGHRTVIQYKEDKKKQVKVPLEQFRRVFSGHFHHHQYVSEKVLYCGSPMQHHFGDSGDAQRGIVIYHPVKDQIDFVQNPKWDAFRSVELHSDKDLGDLSQYRGKFVQIKFHSTDVVPESVQTTLLGAGALQAKKHSIVFKKIASMSHKNDSPQQVTSFIDYVPEYVQKSHFEDSKMQQMYIEKGKALITGASPKKSALNSLPQSTTSFKAELVSIEIENFLGVQKMDPIDFTSMKDGVWYIEGANGTGKSTLLEAITWCLFGRFLRSDMKVDYAVNDVTRKNCRVAVTFSSGHTIERFRDFSEKKNANHPVRKGSGVRVHFNGNYLSDMDRGATKDSQVRLEELIGIDFDTFSKSVIVGDNIVSLLSTDANQRREMIEQLLGFDQFDLFLKHARDERKAKNAALDVEKNELKQIEYMIRFQARDKENLEKEQVVENKDELEKELSVLNEKYDQVMLDHEKKKEILDSIPNNLVHELNSLLGKKQHMEEQIVKLANVETSELEQVEKQVRIVEQDIEKLGETNPVITRIIGTLKNLVHRIVSIIRQHQVNVQQTSVTTLETSIKELEKIMITKLDMNWLEIQFDQDLRVAVRQLTDFSENTRVDLGTLKQKQIQLLESKKDVETKLKMIQHSGTVTQKRLEQVSEELKIAQDKHTIIVNKIESLEREVACIEYWDRAFDKKARKGDITMRSILLDQSVQDVNSILAEFSKLLGPNALQVSFDSDLMINEEYGKRSAGQRKRNHLVILLSLFELVRQRSRFRADFLMLDEVFDALDKEGQGTVTSVIDMLAQRIRKVFIITHSPLMERYGHGSIKTVMNERGTQYEIKQ
jgi:recombinational DNA repair ATPase RecF/predicted phosphodiesterase